MIDYVAEQLKTIRNLCDIALLIREEDLYPDTNHFNTLVELILGNVQDLIDDTCVVRKDDGN
jgi:hypothetical protein